MGNEAASLVGGFSYGLVFIGEERFMRTSC